MKTNREAQPASVPPVREDKQAGETKQPWRHCQGVERGVWTKNMLNALEKGVKGSKWFSLIDKIASDRTLAIAWERVQSNAGACGVDGNTVGTFAQDSENRLLTVREHLKEGTYLPKAIKRVYVPKAGSRELRPLGIPTVTDRVVQTAVKMVIEPIFEREFVDTSYGFRPGRGCKEALREVERHLRAGYEQVVDVDIKGYFDNIPHDKLMAQVRERIADGRVLEILEKFLKAGVLEEGIVIDPVTGTPQGGIVSPLLANLYLHPLDLLLASAGLRSVRYADDIVVLAESAEEARSALQKIEKWMEEAELRLHPEKTQVVDMREAKASFDFLGYRFKRSERGKLLKLVRPKSAQAIRRKLRKATKRSNRDSLETIIEQINPSLRGWYGYFKSSHRSELQAMDGWVRMRLRSILRKRRKRRGRGRGSDHQRWPNGYFADLMLFSLETAREEELSLHSGVKR